ncbi:MAG TPA: hypothetical protein DF383_00155, partial [Deltaproteobacteria bacterium]|nr:hypothetical protein [Deltaproteobacteria bacterium]
MKTKPIFLNLTLLALLAGCSGNSLLGDPNITGTTATLAIAGTHHLENGNALVPHADGTKTFTNDLGYEIVLEEAAVNWKTLRLLSSGEDPECEGGNDPKLEINRSENLLDEDLLAHVLAEHEIPRVAYCSYEIELAPGLITVQASKYHAEENHVGGHEPITESFYLTGSWSQGGIGGEFHFHSTESFTVEGIFHSAEEEEGPHPFHFHEGESEKQILFGIAYDRLFQGIDFQTADAETLSEKVKENFHHAIHQHLGAIHED